MDTKTVIKRLNIYYYGVFFLLVVLATVTYLLITHDILPVIDPLSRWGKVIQYAVIFDVLTTVPLGLWWHKRQCKQIAKIEDEQTQFTAYYRCAAIRICLVSNTMLLAIPAFYILGAYKSMMWVAAISAIGWYFTKPTEKKLYFELHPDEEQY